MSEPKFAVGDLVDCRASNYRVDGATITEIHKVEDGRCGESLNGQIGTLKSGNWYDIDDEVSVGEWLLFPHNPPADESFEEMMNYLKLVNTDGVEA